MWTVAANNKKFCDALGTYNSLNDPHLHQYFNKPKVRNHMIHAGLMTNEGKVIPETLIKLKRLEEERRQQLHQLLSEVLEKGNTDRSALRRFYDTRTQESEAKWELVERAKNTYSTTHTGSTNSYTSRNQSKYIYSGRSKKSSSSVSFKSYLRNVAQMRPKMFIKNRQRVIKYKRPKSSYGIRSSNKVKPDVKLDKELVEVFSDILSLDGLSFHENDEEFDKSKYTLFSSKKPMSSFMTLCFNGLTANCLTPRRIQISQQLHSGGNAIIIFDAMVMPGENLTFGVRPHGDRPFSITVLIDGIRDLRVSTCCEYKHKNGSKISHFTIVNVSGNKMCANCRKSANSGTKIMSTNVVSDTIKDDNKQQIDEEVSDSDVDGGEQQTIIKLDNSSDSSSPIKDSEDYESEFESESVPESTRFRTSSVSSDDSNVGHQEVVEVEVHNNP
ncbi:glutamate-rich protein 3-like [Oppia nitens]|uniref:glutamate-rich protein 3-like n=1 Tax=Oppia nitens TaxID=1686743 RepID=UPI0023DB94B6|nr:glutamate-rich protein 3-like [Oppia nitens]